MNLLDDSTPREIYAPAMEIENLHDAQEYLRALIERRVRLLGITPEQALVLERSNLGYYAGYYSPEVRERVFHLYGAAHPIFGILTPTPAEALQAGIDFARKQLGIDDEPQDTP